MTFSNQVSIGPEFFAKAKNDYSDWHWALAREFMQNSLDAPGTTEIEVTVDKNNVVVRNNGKPMDKDTIVNKLLSLGSSGKSFAGSVGGFGKAKEILYFTHSEYKIRTGYYLITGSGAAYNIEKMDDFYEGTESTIKVDEEDTDKIRHAFAKFVTMCQSPDVSFTVNNSVIDGNLHKGSRRIDLGWCVVYTNNKYANRMIVRIDGTPMFTKYVDSNDKCVVIELNGASNECLMSNRDGLRLKYSMELDELIRKITVDKKSAFRNVETTYDYYAGSRLQSDSESNNSIADLVSSAYANTTKGNAKVNPQQADNPAELNFNKEITNVNDAGKSSVSHEFIIKNCLGMVIPSYYTPVKFGGYGEKIVKYWVSLMMEMHNLFEDDSPFSVGFIFDEEREAEFERGGFGNTFYINPVVVTRNSYGGRSLSKRWKLNSDGKNALIMLALHEYVHKCGYHYHDESYANALTKMAGVVLKNKSRFNKCFS